MRKIMSASSAAFLFVFGLAVSIGHGEMMSQEKGMRGGEGMMTEHKLMLKADSAGQGAKGEVVIKESGKNMKEISIHMDGLKPNSVFTVWLVNMKPKMDMMGLGKGNYSFKSDSQGNGHYMATLNDEELHKWEMLEVAYHSDGDAMNMKKMGIALKAGLMMDGGGMMKEPKGMMDNSGMMGEQEGMKGKGMGNEGMK